MVALADLGRQDGGLSVQVQPDQEVDLHGRRVGNQEVAGSLAAFGILDKDPVLSCVEFVWREFEFCSGLVQYIDGEWGCRPQDIQGQGARFAPAQIGGVVNS